MNNKINLSDPEKSILDIITLGNLKAGEGMIQDIMHDTHENFEIIERLCDLGLVQLTQYDAGLHVALTRLGWNYAREHVNCTTRETLFAKQVSDSFHCNTEIIQELWEAMDAVPENGDAFQAWEEFGIEFVYSPKAGVFRWTLGTGGPSNHFIFKASPSMDLLKVEFHHIMPGRTAIIPIREQDRLLWLAIWEMWRGSGLLDQAMSYALNVSRSERDAFFREPVDESDSGPRMMAMYP